MASNLQSYTELYQTKRVFNEMLKIEQKIKGRVSPGLHLNRVSWTEDPLAWNGTPRLVAAFLLVSQPAASKLC